MIDAWGCPPTIVTLSASGSGGWRPGIGDPTVYGWLTVAGYLAVAVLCAIAWRRSVRRGDAPDGAHRASGRWFWLIIAGAFALLAINKQLDLQSWLTHVGRDIAKDMGWYGRHRQVQRWFVAAVAALAALAVVGVGLVIRRRPRPYAVAFAGLIFTAAFVVIRAASFHHVDHLLGRRLGLVPWNFVLEFGGIALTAAGAGLHLRRQGR